MKMKNYVEKNSSLKNENLILEKKSFLKKKKKLLLNLNLKQKNHLINHILHQKKIFIL